MNAPIYEIVHVKPGLLKVRAAELWDNPALAESVREALECLPEVESVEPEAVTGTLTVAYDPAEEAVVLACLRQQLPEEADLQEHREGDLPVSAEPVGTEPLALPRERADRLTREQARARAARRRRFAAGFAAAAVAVGLLARRLLIRR
jgi:hypothetical protein